MEVSVENISKENPEAVNQENKANESTPPPQQQDQLKKTKKEERKESRKDDKNLEQFMKSLNSIQNADEKLSQVCKKYVQASEENKKLQFYIKQSDKRYALVLKEKDQLQQEFNKTVLVKSKLENLCRELQKQNKAIKEESLLKIREEEERRKETQAKFQNTLSEITTLLHQNNEKNTKLRDDNISMSEKFKSVVSQYQLREQQVDKMAKQMALESQLSEAKLQKASLEHQAEKGKLLADMEQLKMEIVQAKAKINELQGTEVVLRGQIDVYTDKYDEFQNALVKSNQVFGGFKGEMEKMSKKILKLEKESLSWKKRWETSQTALIDMCTERQAAADRTTALATQLQHMQGLCRTLQAERTVLLSTLKDNNIERPPLPAVPAMPAPPTPPANDGSNAKIDAMASNCVKLRQSLASLQNQLNVLTNKKEEEQQPVEKPKSKKSKSKKNKSGKNIEKEESSDSKNESKDVSDSNEPVQEVTGNTAAENLIQKTENEVNKEENGLNDKVTVENNEKQVKTQDNNVTVEKTKESNVTVEKTKENKVAKTAKAKENTDKNGVKESNAENEILNEKSFVEDNPNDELAHIPEIKPILMKPEEVSS